MKSRLSASLVAAAMALGFGFSASAFAAGANASFPARPDAAVTSHIRAWKDAMQALAAKGFSRAVLMPSVETAGGWVGIARDKNGKRVDVTVDAKGNVTAR